MLPSPCSWLVPGLSETLLIFYRMRECLAEASTHSVWLAGLSMGLSLLLLSFGMVTGLTRGDQWKKRRVPWVSDGRIEEDGARGHFQCH